MLKLILPWVFSTFDMDQFAKNFLTGQQHLHVWLPVVLCTCPVQCLHFCNLFLFVIGKMWTNINYLFILLCVFLVCYRLYITVPIFLYFCFLLAQLRINFGQISVYHTLCLPYILHVHYLVYCWLCQFAVLDFCKRPTQDGLFGLVSYRVPLALRQSIL